MAKERDFNSIRRVIDLAREFTEVSVALTLAPIPPGRLDAVQPTRHLLQRLILLLERLHEEVVRARLP